MPPHPVLTDPLAELTTNPRIPLAEPIRRGRSAVRAAVAELLAVPDTALESPWRWRPDDPAEMDVRYGFYRIHEALDAAAAAAGSGVGGVGGPAVPRLASLTAARWELHGALVSLPEAAWDADPGGGEWTIRRTVAHINSGQRAYGWTTAWFLSRAGGPDAGTYAPEGALPEEPEEADEAAGPLVDVLDRLDGLVDQAAEHLATLDAEGLAVPGRWSDVPVTVDFRLGRLGSHIREHTVQVDKTVAMLGLPVSEVDRLARLILATWGRLEATVFGRSLDADPAGEIVEAAAREAAVTASAVRRAAGG